MSVAAISNIVNNLDIAPALFAAFPRLVSIAACPEIDSRGVPTGRTIVWVGREPPRRGTPPAAAGGILSFLAGATGNALFKNLGGQFVIRERDEFPAVPQDLRSRVRVRPAFGGSGVMHPRGAAGTLGCAVTLDGMGGHFLSCRHVLTGSTGSSIGDAIYQPEFSDGIGDRNQIGTLVRWVPERYPEANEVDAAIGLASAPSERFLRAGMATFGVLGGHVEATARQAVILAGASTPFASGVVECVNVPLRMRSGHLYVNQVQYTLMTRAGDSGAVIADAQSRAAVGLHFAATNLYSYANPIKRVLEVLGERRTGISTPLGDKDFLPARIEVAPGGTVAKANSLQPQQQESLMGSPVINLYVCCGENGPHGPAQVTSGSIKETEGQAQGLPRFSRLRFFNGTTDTSSGKPLTQVSYTPKRNGVPGTPVPLPDLPMTAANVKVTGANHENVNAQVGTPDNDARPTEIEIRLKPGAGAAVMGTLKLTQQQINDGYYFRRVTLEYRSTGLFADYVYGKDDLQGNPMQDFCEFDQPIALA